MSTKTRLLLLLMAFLSFAAGRYFTELEQIREAMPYAERLAGLSFTDAERDSAAEGVLSNLQAYQRMRNHPLPNAVSPALHFSPLPPNFQPRELQEQPNRWTLLTDVVRPQTDAELAFYSIPELAALLRSRAITSEELTRIYLDRLKKYGDTLACVVTLTEDLALRQARRADAEIERGYFRSILHGIPYGIKDLFAVQDYPTTWGAMPYKNQSFDYNATVVEKLEAAGAVLTAKLSLGALAWGDVWFRGTTRNPWNLNQGSSGSSAGSAAATSAGLVGFAIGTETWGSIVSPATRCGISGLRPTFGRVSRHGAMALSWSMDKVGPMCRTAQGCAMVFDALRGTDGLDLSLKDYPFNFTGGKPQDLKVAYFEALFTEERDKAVLQTLREKLGLELTPIALPDDWPVREISFILTAEAAAAFDQLTRSNQDSLLVRQIKNAWPNVFREGQYIPAVAYIQANRHRSQIIERMHRLMKPYDVVLTPTFGGTQLLLTNLTGHPCVVVPNGFREAGSPTSISFLGNLFDEAAPLLLAQKYQEVTDFDEQHPPLFSVK